METSNFQALAHPRARDKGDAHIARTMSGAVDCWNDHRLLISRLQIKIHHQPRQNKPSIP